MDYTSFAILSVLVLGLTEVIKIAGLSKKLIPLVALVVGVGISFLGSDIGTQAIVVRGLVMGLTAVGLFSGVKNTIRK